MSFPTDALKAVEIVSLLVTSIFFSLLYEKNRDLTWSGIIASIIWMVLGMHWFVTFATNPSYSFSLLWVGIGLIYIVRFMADLISMRHADRRLAGDEQW